MSWLIKYLGWKAIKALIKKFIVTTWTRPGMHRLARQIQKYVDDPDTDGDEKLVAEIEKFGNYWIEKRIK